MIRQALKSTLSIGHINKDVPVGEITELSEVLTAVTVIVGAEPLPSSSVIVDVIDSHSAPS